MHLGRRLASVLMTFLLLFTLSPTTQFAKADTASHGWKENITLTAKDIGTFTLDSNTSQMLFVEDAVPGDTWTGEITIKNQAGGPVKVSLLSISNKLTDQALYNILDLDIWIGDKTVYSGKYSETPATITDFYVIPAGSSLEMTVRISFPPEADNQLQGKKMDSTWTFEARYAGKSDETTLYPYRVRYLDRASKEPLIEEKHGYAAYADTITEYAVDLVGYKPDAQKKNITIGSGNNMITFYYQKVGNAPVPNDSEAPSDTPSNSVKTGENFSVSNTSSAIYLIITFLCGICILIIWCKVVLARNRVEHRNNK